MAEKIDRTKLGSGCYKSFTMSVHREVPDYYDYPLVDLSDVKVGKNGIEKMTIFWPKHWWQRALVVEVFNVKEQIGRQRYASFFETQALRKLYYPNDIDLCWSIARTYEIARDKRGLEHNTDDELKFRPQFMSNITDPVATAFLRKRVFFF